eukprot:23541_1
MALSSAVTLNAFENLNKTLGEYYQSQGDKTYYNNDDSPEGKFLAYCEENGFELDDIDEEFENEPGDCIYCDFDEAFPLDDSIEVRNEEERLSEVFKVIKYCYLNGKAPKYMNALKIELATTADDLKTAETRYTAQCPKIFLQSQEETLKEVFAIGLKNDFPFISYLVDAYQRDRMLSAGKDLTAATWAKESPYIKHITSKSKKQANTIESGIETYMKRVAPRFHWKAMNKIADDIKPIIKYFVTAGQFVQSLLERQETTPPFGYDVVIVAKNAVSSSTMVMPDLSGTDTEDDDDDEDPADDDDLKLNGANNTSKYLSNFEERLSVNACQFVRKTLNINDKQRGPRFWMETFRDLCTALEENKYGKKSDYNMSEYPRKKRFCTMIDRREGGDEKEDSMIMFEPPDDSNTLPDQHVPSWYFNAGKTCIVPSKRYKDGTSGSSAVYDPQNTLCVDRAYKGQVLTISFHVDSSTSVRCYLFWNGCYIRIVYPQDLKIILNAIFDTTYNKNEEYIKGKQCDEDIQQLKLVDADFDVFYKEVTMVNNK